MEILKVLWKIVQFICVLYSFGTIIWKFIPLYWQEIIKITYRRFFRKKGVNEKSKMGCLLLNDIKLITGVDRKYEIILTVENNGKLNVPKEFPEIARRLQEENSLRLKLGENPIYSELFPYAVHEIEDHPLPAVHGILPYRVGEKETPVCKVLLRKSSYFFSLISICAMDEIIDDDGTTIREKYYKKLIQNPGNAAPNGLDIVHGFGMNTMVLTKDHSFVFSIRNPNTVSTVKGCVHVSVGEHLNEDSLDQDQQTREPCAVETISKGILQELGIRLQDEEKRNIHFYGVGFSESVCQYGVLGFTYLKNYSNEDIQRAWELSKDGRYENKGIHFVDANIKSVVKYLNDNPDVCMTKFALLNVCLALMFEPELNYVKQDKIDKELSKIIYPQNLIG